MCFNCFETTKREDPFYLIPMCFECSKNEPLLQCITKTIAKKKYCINDKDLDNLEFILKINPHYRSGSAMTLYLESDVIKLSNRKHNNKLDEEKKKRELKRYNMITKKNERIKKRKNELFEKLKENGLELRPDSKLCSGYIDGSLKKWTLDQVVHMVGEMKWLFEYTPYKETLDTDVKYEAKELREYDGLSWSAAYHITFQEIEPYVRANILKKYPIPPKFPWIKDKKKLLLTFRK